MWAWDQSHSLTQQTALTQGVGEEISVCEHVCVSMCIYEHTHIQVKSANGKEYKAEQSQVPDDFFRQTEDLAHGLQPAANSFCP